MFHPVPRVSGQSTTVLLPFHRLSWHCCLLVALGGSAPVFAQQETTYFAANGAAQSQAGAFAGADEAIAAGEASQAVGVAAIAVGSGASATGDRSMALGRNAFARDENSLAFGSESRTEAEHALAIGAGSYASGLQGTASAAT